MKIIEIIKKYFLCLDEAEPWQIVAARYCVENSEKGFTKEELKTFLDSKYSILSGHFEQFFEEEIYLPTGRKFSRNGYNGVWIPPLDLVSKVTDYDELKEARKNSRQAFLLSVMAIIISGLSFLVQLFK